MVKVLVAWIGNTDLRAPIEYKTIGLGPIAQAVDAGGYSEIALLCDYSKAKVDTYLKWLKNRTTSKVIEHYIAISSPTNFGQIYAAAIRVVAGILDRYQHNVDLTYHLSPGTPAMSAVWIILAKTRFPAELIESSKEHGVRTASVPFDISADFIPDLLSGPDKRLKQTGAALPPDSPEFSDIIYRSQSMHRIISKARKVAPRSVPVLIEGESGTGKELLARAIHITSPRKAKPFIAVNCGAIPENLIGSELFGHVKGAFTGAAENRMGYFENAHGGTLFLDEIGELPLPAQVKILRALQEGEIVRVGSTKPITVDIRIIAATNRTLTQEIAVGRFRADLFYRLAVAILKLPPLRDRQGDISLLIDRSIENINRQNDQEPGYKHKKISASAKNLLLKHAWPGNVRELINTLLRAATWSDGEIIDKEDIKEALIDMAMPGETDIMDKPLQEGLSIQEIMSNVAQHYLRRALEETRGNKTEAAKLLGLPSYQTFSNWMDKYGVK